MGLDQFPLRAKILVPIVLLALTALGISAFGATRLVTASATQVGAGVKLAADAGTALERIISEVSEINKVVTEIANGAQEEASGLSQINTAINHMDQTTQQNATMVEDSTAASHSLSHETSELAKLVDQLRVGEAAAAATRRDPPRRTGARAAA